MDSYSNQKLYFNSFSYKPQITEEYGLISGYTNGVFGTTTGVVNSKYSGFNSNLISYYSNMDSKSNGYQATCGGSVQNVRGLDPAVANFNTTFGLSVSPYNRFSWVIFQNGNYNFLRPTSTYTTGTVYNQGYFPNEIVEGGPVMYTNLNLHDYYVNTWNYTETPKIVYDVTNQNNNFAITSNYYSQIYDTTGNTLNFTLGSLDPTINSLGGYKTVMRGDRLPTSTNVDEYCCNGMVLQKNPNFQIYLIPEDGILNISSSLGTTGSASSGDYEYLRTDLQNSVGISRVFDTFTCGGSVNLECYTCGPTIAGGPNSTVLIKPHSCQEFLGETIFEYGCYRFITTIFLSLFKDWELMAEWISRNMVMLGACRNVFSHRFVNNWINGVLYAFPFKNEVKGYTSPTSETPNQPIAEYCTQTLAFHRQTKNFYYRSAPYDTTTNEFVTNSYGDIGFPTTIIDLGPRADYIQEIVMSDDYDGYVVNKLDTSSFGTVDEILNLFIVSRFINQDFIEKLIGSLNILGYFTNDRKKYGNGGTSLMVDADYSQLISINSELGVAPFLPANYPDNPDPTKQNPIFFDCDNVLGIFFSSDTQLRDYITPKRTIINPSGSTTSKCTFNNFPVFSQRVPISQWLIRDTEYIFGLQSNNWDFTVSGAAGSNITVFSKKYQSLDRLDQGSRYFRSNGSSQTQYQKGHIYAVNSSGDTTAKSASWDKNPPGEQLVTVGAPFHFYFGLRRGASSFDRFRTKWINTSNIVN